MTLDERLDASVGGRSPLRVTRRRAVAAVCVGTALALLMWLLWQWTDSQVALVTGAVLLLALAPTASRLNRRLAVNLALGAGWLPLAMWLPSSWLPVSQGASVVLIGIGVVAALGVAHPGRLLPRLRRRDALVAFGGLLAAWVARPLRDPSGPAEGLSLLTLGWDNASHFSMFLEQRLAVAAPPFLPPPVDGSGWFFQHYPQWFHSGLAIVADVTAGSTGSAPSELVHYAYLQWVAFVAIAVFATSAVLQALERVDGLLVVAAAVCVWSLVIAVPGGPNLLQGHLNFLLAALAPAVILLLTMTSEPPRLSEWVAVCGLVVVAAAWMLVLPLALVAAWAAWQRVRRIGGRGPQAAVVLVAAVAAGISVFHALTSLGSPAVEHVTSDGPVVAVSPWLTWVVLVGAVAVTAVWTRVPRSAGADPRILLAFTTTALVLTAAVGAFQLWSDGEVTYYFWKVSLAMVVAVLLVLLAAWMTRRRGPREDAGGVRRLVPATGLVVAGVLGLGLFLQGLPAPSATWALSTSSLLAERQRDTDQAELLLRTTEGLTPDQAATTRLIMTRDEDLNAGYAQQWFHGLSSARTVRAGALDADLFFLGLEPGRRDLATELVEQALVSPDVRVLVTDPALLAHLTRVLPLDDAQRVTLVS
jgi:hypothetical protein